MNGSGSRSVSPSPPAPSSDNCSVFSSTQPIRGLISHMPLPIAFCSRTIGNLPRVRQVVSAPGDERVKMILTRLCKSRCYILFRYPSDTSLCRLATVCQSGEIPSRIANLTRPATLSILSLSMIWRRQASTVLGLMFICLAISFEDIPLEM